MEAPAAFEAELCWQVAGWLPPLCPVEPYSTGRGKQRWLRDGPAEKRGGRSRPRAPAHPGAGRTLLGVEAVADKRQQLQLLEADAQLADLALQLLPGPPRRPPALLRSRRRAEEAQRLVGDGRQPRGPAGHPAGGRRRGLPRSAHGCEGRPQAAALGRRWDGLGAVVEVGEVERARRALLGHGAARQPPAANGGCPGDGPGSGPSMAGAAGPLPAPGEPGPRPVLLLPPLLPRLPELAPRLQPDSPLPSGAGRGPAASPRRGTAGEY